MRCIVVHRHIGSTNRHSSSRPYVSELSILLSYHVSDFFLPVSQKWKLLQTGKSKTMIFIVCEIIMDELRKKRILCTFRFIITIENQIDLMH
jgi:hypothetical protein